MPLEAEAGNIAERSQESTFYGEFEYLIRFFMRQAIQKIGLWDGVGWLNFNFFNTKF